MHLGFAGPPQRVLSSVLHSFLGSDQAGVPFRPTALPVLGLSEGDKQCIRDRSCIMARHIFADKSEEYIQSQVFTTICHGFQCLLSFMWLLILDIYTGILVNRCFFRNVRVKAPLF